MNSLIFFGSVMLVFMLGVVAYVLWDEKRQKKKQVKNELVIGLPSKRAEGRSENVTNDQALRNRQTLIGTSSKIRRVLKERIHGGARQIRRF